MRNLIKFSVLSLLAVLMLSTFTSCERVGPNEQGVLMTDYGKNGKSDFSLAKGRVWTAAPGAELFTVPLWEQRGDFGERLLHLKASDNTEFTAHPMYSYKVIENRAVDVVFDNKQLGSGNDFMTSLMDNILEPHIYDLMKEESRKYTTEALMADGGSLTFEINVQEIIRKAFNTKGLELISFSCQLEFTDKVKEKIDTRNEVNTNISVLDQQIEQQKKMNELEELKTQQNIIKSRGLTPQVLQYEFIQAWKETKQPLYGNLPISLLKN